MDSVANGVPAMVPASAGIGLRGEHYERIDRERPPTGWLEVHSENYFGKAGIPHHYLHRLREHYPISFHGVGLSLGSTDPLDLSHLDRIGEIIDEYQPGLVSEHLSWSSVNGVFVNDLLPFPYTWESLDNFSSRVDKVQRTLDRQILIENPSTYLSFEGECMGETDFLNTLASRTGCGILLDVNNVYVCSCNHGFDSGSYIEAINPHFVKEIHLAGHTCKNFEDGNILIDTHNQRVCTEVWNLFDFTLRHTGKVATLIEWDTDLPTLDVLLDEADHAQRMLDQAHAAAA